MVTPEKIEEWRREVEERPASAGMIIDFIARRLSDLTRMNEELLAENIALRSGHKVEEFESRIANLEYQLDLLKRQFRGAETVLDLAQQDEPGTSQLSLIIYNQSGLVLRVEFAAGDLNSTHEIARLAKVYNEGQAPPRLLATGGKDELLFVFDSGRVQAMPVSSVPPARSASPDWETALLVEPRGLEELVMVLPVARMSLFDLCIQASRRGCVKKLQESFFEACVANSYVGTGVKLPTDKTCDLVLCQRDDLFVLVSQEGAVWCIKAGQLPFTIEEVLRLGPVDHIVTAFNASQKQSLMVITRNGKVLQREISWLEPATSFKSGGQSVISKSRREAGVQVAGAAAVNLQEWVVVLTGDGRLATHQVERLFSAGSLAGEQENIEVIGMAVFSNE